MTGFNCSREFVVIVMRKIVSVCIAVLFINMSACGYFLYPERVGQQGGRLDPAIVVLDAAALLFGILPGVVAFAVDITTGAIYLSPGQKSVLEKHSRHITPHKIRINGNQLRPAEKNEISIDQFKTAQHLSRILGYPVSADNIQYYKAMDLTSAVEVMPAFAMHN